MNEEKSNSHADKGNALVGMGIWIVLGVILIVWGTYWAWIAPLITGNSFDPLNALFSGLAFWGVIYAILLQRSELQLQRNELKLTRGEVRGQKEQLETQNATLKQQRFENTFFSLVNLFNNVVNSIEIRGAPRLGDPPSVIAKGRECFECFYGDFQREYARLKDQSPNFELLNLCVEAYDRFADQRQASVGHYFRTLYNIIKFIETSDVANKQLYVNIVRAQLSSSELNLLFYNCLSRYGNEKFKPFVEHFGLLENMRVADLINVRHKGLYDEKAFKSQC